MCSCDVGFVCSRCKDTPFDPRYFEDEPEPLTEPYFAELVESHDRLVGPVLMLGEEE